MDAIIFDIDGTLSDTTHRVHHVKNGNRNWDDFFSEMHLDGVVPGPSWLLDRLVEAQNFDPSLSNVSIFVVSARPEKYREVTEIWLNNLVPVEHLAGLLMRKDGDYRPDTIVKKEILKGIQGQGYEVKLVIDDRPSVIAMWQDEGIPVLQVPNKDWDNNDTHWEPGMLTLMVGPSGAGKSRFLWGYLNPLYHNIIVSSDDLRKELTGDFKDQSKNEQMWSVLHALVKARIEGGLDTIVDATNLRNRDRRALRDLVPANTKIMYIVMDRPLEDKHRDAGWRDDVVIKGKKLIDYHHQIFKSNLKDILAGDNDPRVVVTDLRM